MKKFAKIHTNKTIAITLSATFIALTIVLASIAVLFKAIGADNKMDPTSSLDSFNSSEVSSQGMADMESSGPAEQEEPDPNIVFNIPDVMRAVYLTPKSDFLITASDNATKIKAQIDEALAKISEYRFNSVVVQTKYNNQVIFKSAQLPQVDVLQKEGFDPLAYIIEAAGKKKLFVYVVYPAFAQKVDDKVSTIGDFYSATKQALWQGAGEFAQRYQPDAIMLDDYYVSKSAFSQSFTQNGTQLSFDDYIRKNVEELLFGIQSAMRTKNKVSQIGLMTDSVWANSTSNSAGSNTKASFECLIDGYADTKKLAESGKFNLIMAEILTPTNDSAVPFETAAKWWSDVTHAAGIPLYIVHASSKIQSSYGAFSNPDQLIRQVNVAEKYKGYCGSAFDSLSRLKENPEGITTALIKYFNNEIKNNLIFKSLTMTQPAKTTMSTYEPSITFSGAADPNFKVLFNGKEISVTKNGYLSITKELAVGKNQFTFVHKGKTVIYTITRKVKLINQVTPTGTVEVDGGTKLTLSAIAYKGSTVYAKIGSTKITLTESTEEDDGIDKNSSYVKFVGEYTAPAATSKEQTLGSLVIYSSWQGFSENKTGAAIKVNKKPDINTSKSIRVTADFAETFPTTILNDRTQHYCVPLAKGTIDYVVGNELVYKEGKETFHYYNLKSGVRVYAEDIQFIKESAYKNNTIDSIALNYNGRYANLVIDNDWNVPYTHTVSPLTYTDSEKGALKTDFLATTVTYRLYYTSKVNTSAITVGDNPLVKKIECKLGKEGDIPVCDVIVTLKTAGGFFSATPYYDADGAFRLQMNVPAPIQKAGNSYGYTLKGAIIAVDAGHDPKRDPGATGVIPGYPEYRMNEMLRAKLVAELQSLGATVITVDNLGDFYSGTKRLEYFRQKNVHLMISIHHNSIGSPTPRGPEALYFNPYSQQLCKAVMNRVGNNYINDSPNRGAKYARLLMVRVPFFPSILIEAGFISNPQEHADLIKPENQTKIAQQITKGMIDYFVKTGSLNNSSPATGDDTSSSGSESSQVSSTQSVSSNESDTTGEQSYNAVVQTSASLALAYYKKEEKLL